VTTQPNDPSLYDYKQEIAVYFIKTDLIFLTNESNFIAAGETV
jgi:hypothetical protein